MPSQKWTPGADTASGLFVHKEVLGAGAVSDPVLIGGRYRSVTVGVTSVGTQARIEYTLDTLAAVEADAAQWVPWASGDVSSNTADNLEGPVTAVRGVAITGVATWHIAAANR